MDVLRRDLLYALRSLRRSPGFTAVAGLTLALGIGANTAMFSLVDGVLLRPLPYPAAERLVVGAISMPDYADLRRETEAFDETALWVSNLYKLTVGDAPEEILGAVVSPEFFELLGPPALGRAWSADEDAQHVAVLSHGLWRRRFGGDPAVLGRTVDLNGETFTVVGVASPRFEYPGPSFELWLPLGQAMAIAREQTENRQLRIFRLLGRLRPGLDAAQANAELAALSERLERRHPETNAGVVLEVEPLSRSVVGDVRTALLVLFAAVGVVLLIACANVANLLLARTTGRAREVAVRAALGAGRGRLARQLLTESAVLAAAGGALGVLLAAWALATLPGVAPLEIPRLAELGLDLRVLLFALAATLATAALFGTAPALHATRGALAPALRQGGRGTAGSRRTARVRSGLVLVEVALATVLLVAGALLLQSFSRLLRQDPGFEAEGALAGGVQLFLVEDEAERTRVLERILERVAAVPGVEAVGGGSGLPPENPQRGTGFEVQGRPSNDPSETSGWFVVATPGYFDALGTAVLAGRAFAAGDRAAAAPVAVVSRALAERFFPGGDAVGAQLRLVNPEQPDDWRTIVGVVEDVRYGGLEETPPSTIYTPFAQTPFLWTNLFVRGSVPPRALIHPVRQAIADVDTRLVPARLEPLTAVVGGVVAADRFVMLLLTSFAALAVLLAAIGVYGVMAYAVARRTAEIGVRVALGARRAQVVRLVLRHALALSATGVALGLLGAVAATRLLQGLLFGVGARDPLTFAAVALALLGVALLASWLPARRAATLDPVTALRAE